MKNIIFIVLNLSVMMLVNGQKDLLYRKKIEIKTMKGDSLQTEILPFSDIDKVLRDSTTHIKDNLLDFPAQRPLFLLKDSSVFWAYFGNKDGFLFQNMEDYLKLYDHEMVRTFYFGGAIYDGVYKYFYNFSLKPDISKNKSFIEENSNRFLLDYPFLTDRNICLLKDGRVVVFNSLYNNLTLFVNIDFFNFYYEHIVKPVSPK